MFRTENGTQWFPKAPVPSYKRTDLIMSNTLQPISSDAGGNSNDLGGSSFDVGQGAFK